MCLEQTHTSFFFLFRRCSLVGLTWLGLAWPGCFCWVADTCTKQQKIARHLSMFGWLLKCRLREDNDQDIIDTMLLGICPDDLAYLSSQRKRSCAGLHRIRQIVAHVVASTTTKSSSSSSSFPLAAQIQIQQNLWELNRMFGRCERLKGSCIPPMYTSHVTRLLVFYLIFLPLALATTTGISRTAALVTTGAVAFAMMGLDEIGHVLEQPFRYVV